MKSLTIAVFALALASSTLARAADETGSSAANSPAPSATPAPAPAATASTASSSSAAPEKQVSAGSAVLTPEQLAALSGWFVSASLDHGLGLGTLVNPELYASFSAIVNAYISYRTHFFDRAFAVGLQPFGLLGISYEYTMPDVETGRRWAWYDARVALSMPAVYKEPYTGITVSPSLNFVLPTTIESWHAGMILRVGGGASATRTFETKNGLFMFSLSGVGTAGVYRTPQNLVPASNALDPQGNHVVLSRSGEPYSAVSNNNSAISIQGSTSATWGITEKLFLSVGYTIVSNWNYSVTDGTDPFTAKGVDVNGNPAAKAGMGRTNQQIASVSFSFNLTDAWSGSLYIFNNAPLLTSDGKNVRFPWADVTGIANNNTSVGFSLAATY